MRLRWLGSEALTWRDLWVIVSQCPRDSSVSRALHGEAAEWGIAEHLAAAAVDEMRLFRWSFTEDAAEGRTSTAPDPIPRPGVVPVERPGSAHFGDQALEISDLRAALGLEDLTNGRN